MRMDDFTRTPALKAASAIAALAGLLFVWSLVRALAPDELPRATPVSVASLDVKRAPVRPIADVQAAVENDLFSPDRTAPSEPYRMPGEAGPDDKPRVEPQKPVVLGTAVASDGRHFATLRLGDASPQLVRVGDRIGEWVVRAISRGKVVIESTEGARAELAVPKPGT